MAVATALAVLAAGCGKAPAPAAANADNAVLERIEATIDQLQTERTTGRPEVDLGDMVEALRVNKEPDVPPPPPPPPAPEAEPSAPTPAPEDPGQLRLQGIVRHPTAPLVIINGKTLGVGETIARHRIERIGEDEVVLAAPDGSERNLRFHELPPPSP